MYPLRSVIHALLETTVLLLELRIVVSVRLEQQAGMARVVALTAFQRATPAARSIATVEAHVLVEFVSVTQASLALRVSAVQVSSSVIQTVNCAMPAQHVQAMVLAT